MVMVAFSGRASASTDYPCADVVEPVRLRGSRRPLVSVVIPCYNAAATVDATLESVRVQTYQEIEIIVVDDGSTDDSVNRIESHAAADSRIRLVRQPNAGVASARNRGIAESTGDYVAPVDADDLWHPQKIERQMAVMVEGGPTLGLVFTRYAVIDEDGYLVSARAGSVPASLGFIDLCRRNFIGNGSSALMRRDAIVAAGGYDSSLRARQAQGCEDLMLYLQIVENYRVAMVPEPLTGYRQFTRNMSSDGSQMLRSFDLVAGSFCGRRPELRPAFADHRVYMLRWLTSRAVSARRWKLAYELCRQLFARTSPRLAESAVLTFIRVMGWPLRRLVYPILPATGRRFPA